MHLTTHRLLFHASIPPDHGTKTGALSSTQSAVDDATARQPDVLQAGPVTVHFPGAIRPSRRVWMELSSEMVTTYPGADEASRVRPLRCVLCKSINLISLTPVVSSVRQLEPIDLEHPRDFYVEYKTATGWKRSHISVDTEVGVFLLDKADQRISNQPDSGGGPSMLHYSARCDINGANQTALALPITGQ